MPNLTIDVQLGVQIAPQHLDYETIRTAVLRLEDMGVDAIFNWDHFFPLTGDPHGAHFEAWTMLGSWAELTERVQLGCLVNCNAYRNADLQADMARTLDHMTAQDGTGRFIFGIGAGIAERDFSEFGYEFGTVGARLNDLAESLPRIEKRLAVGSPQPTRKIPVLIGGAGELKTLRLVARHADIWHSYVTPRLLPQKLAVIEQWAEQEGRDTSHLIVSNELKGRRLKDADALFDGGVRLFTLGLSGPDLDFEAVQQWLAWRDAKNGR